MGVCYRKFTSLQSKFTLFFMVLFYVCGNQRCLLLVLLEAEHYGLAIVDF
jgi:hypothetical protein